MAALIPRVSAFDPGGPPVGGAAPSVVTGNWEYVNYQPTGGSYSPQNQINKDTVQYLETKWIYPYTEPAATKLGAGSRFGSGAPVLAVEGVAYVVLNDRRILAIDIATGKLIWNNTYGQQFDGDAVAINFPYAQKPQAHVHAMNYYREKGWLITSSLGSCNLYAVDAKTGKTAWTISTQQICGTNEEFGDPAKGIAGSIGGRGFMSSQGTHPPQFLGNIMFYPVAGASGGGGRSFVTAFDMSDSQNPKRLYRTFVMPPPEGDPNWAIDQCKIANGNGWYFEYPKYLEGVGYPDRAKPPTYLATKCTDVDPDVVKNDWIDLVPSSKTFGKLHTADAISPVWGNYPLDPETGIVYMGWGDQGPYGNLTNRYGPGLHGSGLTAFDVKTGKLVWWFAANPHDMWDYDCSWSGILGQVSGKKAFIKGCKDGKVYALDAATGKPFWIWDAPTIKRIVMYGVDRAIVVGGKVLGDNTPTGPGACCRMNKKDMSKGWMIAPDPGPMVRICGEVCLESDIAYDGKKVYIGHFNWMDTKGFGPVLPFANNDRRGIPGTAQSDFPGVNFETNTNIDAVDVNTGKLVWTYRVENSANRGGVMVTGGMVVAYLSDGNLRFIDAETGKLLHTKFFGIPVNVMPTVGATKDGKMRIFLHVGGGGGFLFGNNIPVGGSLVALGLPDSLPQPQVITKEVIKEVPKEVIKEVIKEVPKEVIKEVIKEVPKEVIKEVVKEVPKEVPKEVIKEVIKEVPKTVTVETISPISYAAIGIALVLIVVSGVLFTRRKKA